MTVKVKSKQLKENISIGYDIQLTFKNTKILAKTYRLSLNYSEKLLVYSNIISLCKYV